MSRKHRHSYREPEAQKPEGDLTDQEPPRSERPALTGKQKSEIIQERRLAIMRELLDDARRGEASIELVVALLRRPGKPDELVYSQTDDRWGDGRRVITGFCAAARDYGLLEKGEELIGSFVSTRLYEEVVSVTEGVNLREEPKR